MLPINSEPVVSITLSSSDIMHLTQASRLLCSPLAFPTADEWRLAVNRELRPLLGADSAGFMLPGAGELAMLSEEHDPRALVGFPELEPPSLEDGTPIVSRAIKLGVTTLKEAYGSQYQRWANSAYYNEYAAPNQVHDAMAAWYVGSDGVPTTLHFWHATAGGRKFSDRETLMLRLITPALQAGVETHLRLHAGRAGLFASLDSSGVAARLVDPDGVVVHSTAALAAMLAGDRDPAFEPGISAALEQFRARLGRYGDPRAGATVLQTDAAIYRVFPTVLDDASGQRGPLVMCVVHRLSRTVQSDDGLRSRWGLSAAEARVARALLKGHSDKRIADDLVISVHTARHHVARVRSKLGVRSRGQAVAVLLRAHLAGDALVEAQRPSTLPGAAR